jgi:hypothetical protein
MIICMIIIIVLLIIFIIYLRRTDYYFLHNIRPYKKVKKNKIKKILIGLPSIDRDIKKASKMYKSLINSINNLNKNTDKNTYNIDLLVITRDSDKKIINFWKDKANIITVPHYVIEKRHNFENIIKKFNELINQSKEYDVLTIIESDVYIKKNTLENLIKNLKKNHITLAYGDVPWLGTPIVIVPSIFYPKIINANNENNFSVVLGSWTGAVAIRTEVFKDCKFELGAFKDILGQDVGFYQQAFKKRYKVFMIDDVYHDYY